MASPRTKLKSVDEQTVEIKPGAINAAGAVDLAEPTETYSSALSATTALDASRMSQAVETLLITAERPMPLGRMNQLLVESGFAEDVATPSAIKGAIESLNESYAAGGRAFRIESVAGGFRVMTLPEFAPIAAAVRGLRESTRLSRAAIETLAIVAYRQPITRVDIESIRGSATGEVLRTLLEKRLVAIVGRSEELGRPMLYGTAKRFLEIFGLSSIRDLPPIGEAFPGVDASKVKRRPSAAASEEPATSPAEASANDGPAIELPAA